MSLFNIAPAEHMGEHLSIETTSRAFLKAYPRFDPPVETFKQTHMTPPVTIVNLKDLIYNKTLCSEEKPATPWSIFRAKNYIRPYYSMQSDYHGFAHISLHCKSMKVYVKTVFNEYIVRVRRRHACVHKYSYIHTYIYGRLNSPKYWIDYLVIII